MPSRFGVFIACFVLAAGSGACRDRCSSDGPLPNDAAVVDAARSLTRGPESGPEAARLTPSLDAAPAVDAFRDPVDAETPDPTPPATELYPQGRPRRTGRFRVSEIHELYWELAGTKGGVPAIELHGGPGGRASPFSRRLFDPDRFDVLLFDQRGAGRSRPRGEWRENTTQLLVADIEALRAHVGFTEPAILLGGSWGSTLAIAYAEAYPEKVAGIAIRGVFLCTRAEIDHFYHGGTAPFFPENFAALQAVVPHPERRDYPRQLFEMITSGNRSDRDRAVRGWARYEMRMVSTDMTDERALRMTSSGDWSAFSTLENHYMMHGCFLEEGQLLRDAWRIADIPVAMVSGRQDVICPPHNAAELAKRLKRVRHEIVPDGAHSSRDPPIGRAFLRAVDWVADRVEGREGR